MAGGRTTTININLTVISLSYSAYLLIVYSANQFRGVYEEPGCLKKSVVCKVKEKIARARGGGTSSSRAARIDWSNNMCFSVRAKRRWSVLARIFVLSSSVLW